MSIFVADEQDDPLPIEDLRRLAEQVLQAEGLDAAAEVALLFVPDPQITDYNERFMGRKGPTDVLAFPLEDLKPGAVPVRAVNGPPLNLGDVIVAPTYVRRQAEERGVTFDDELALMVVHGMLHLLGYDHKEDPQAEVMEARERDLMARVGRKRP